MIVFALILLVFKRTRIGLDIRAVSQNRAMAKAMGIRTEWVDAMTFGLGAGVAGVAGVALSQLTNVGPNLGQSYIIDSFLVVVSGASAISGVAHRRYVDGMVNELLEPYPEPCWRKYSSLWLSFCLFRCGRADCSRQPGGRRRISRSARRFQLE